MGLFSKELANVIEWDEFREDCIFYKWNNKEIKKGSRLIIRPGQDAIFLANGRLEGVFEEEGDYDIESQIIPFLSTLKGFKFGFNSGLRAEIVFVNTKEFTVKWGTRSAINIPTPSLPGGMPIRANGTYTFCVNDYLRLIEQVAGIKQTYYVEDVKLRITSVVEQLLMKWIVKEGKDMFNLQANSFEICNGIAADLDAQVSNIGLHITGFQVMSFNYPEEVQKMITKTASQSMVGDLNRYQQVSMIDAMAEGKSSGGNAAMDMASMMMGMNMANQMMQGMNQNQTINQSQNMNQNQSLNHAGNTNPPRPNFCPNCGTKTQDSNFCPNCGFKLV